MILDLRWVHKLVTLVLAARLKDVTRKLMQDTQSTFIQGRKIFKGRLLASKMVDEMRRIGEGLYLRLISRKLVTVWTGTF